MAFGNPPPHTHRVSDEIYKLCSINLSPNVTGQLALGIMCNPPLPGSESYALHMQEKDALLQSMVRRARTITDAFNRYWLLIGCMGPSLPARKVFFSFLCFRRSCKGSSSPAHVLCSVLCGDFVVCLDLVRVNALRMCCSAIDALPVDTRRAEGGGSETPYFF